MKELYTPALLAKFDRLTLKLSSHDQMTRLNARMNINRFIEEHGREVCDAMFAVLRKKDVKKCSPGK